MSKKISEDAQSQLEHRVKELEKALREATTLLEVAKEKTGIDIKKNFGSRRFNESGNVGRVKK